MFLLPLVVLLCDFAAILFITYCPQNTVLLFYSTLAACLLPLVSILWNRIYGMNLSHQLTPRCPSDLSTCNSQKSPAFVLNWFGKWGGHQGGFEGPMVLCNEMHTCKMLLCHATHTFLSLVLPQKFVRHPLYWVDIFQDLRQLP